MIENLSKLERIESNSIGCCDGLSGSDVGWKSDGNNEDLFLGVNCFASCESLSSTRFESGSRLSRIEHNVFAETGLIEIIHPSSVEFLVISCFSECG
jgi:hypothetical protein